MKTCGGNFSMPEQGGNPDCPPSLPNYETDVKPVNRAAPLLWFEDMIDHCLEYAIQMRNTGHPIVGILCEYTPRELIMAAGAVPVCLCGGSSKMIPPAEEHLPANLCPLIKSTFGFHLQKKNPFLEMADWIVAETTCDGKKKMYELMGQSRPMYVLNLPHRDGSESALNQWTEEMHLFKEALEKRYGVAITREKMRQAILVMNRERQLRRELAGLMKSESPPLTGRQLLDLKSSISGIPADLAQYEAAIKMLRDIVPTYRNSKPVRVLLTGVPIVHGAERVMEIIENHHGLVVCQENCTGLKPIMEDIDPDAEDLVRAMAVKYYHTPCSVKTPNPGRLDLIRQLAQEYRPQCIIDLIWQACLTYDVESALIRQLAEKELHLPYLRIETDYSPSDSARIAVRVEALFETVKNKCDASAWTNTARQA